MGDIFSDVQLDISGDTYETLGINKENVRSDAYVVDQVGKWLRGEIDEEPDVGAIWAGYPDYDHGMALGTSAEIGRLFPKDPRVTNWAERQKYNLSQTAGGDAKAMNALGTVFTQGVYRGQQSAINDLLGGGEEEPTPVPTPQPTPGANPYPEGTAEWEIWEDEQRRQGLETPIRTGAGQ